MKRLLLTASGAATAIVLATSSLHAQSFALDENPAMPLSPGGPVLYPGYGAENPYAVPWPHGLGFAPSPSLGVATLLAPECDGVLLQFGPTPQLPPPGGWYPPPGKAWYYDSLSDDSALQWTAMNVPIRLRFSVDRITGGLGGTALASEFGFNQQPSDIYLSTTYFKHPANFVGWGSPMTSGYQGVLPALLPGATSNTLFTDESVYGLATGGPGLVTPPNMPAPPIMFGTHDNIDQFDSQFLDLNGDQFNDTWMYFTLYPDEALTWPPAFMPADIFDVATNAGVNPGVPFATALQVFGPIFELDHESIDALVVWDMNLRGSPAFNGPGAEPGIDYALFSLAPGSFALQQWGLSSADVFFTDFSGKFFKYAAAGAMGIAHLPGGAPGSDGNMDGLEVDQCADDLNGNGQVDFGDILAIMAKWGPCPPAPVYCAEDRNGNNAIDFADINAVIAAWGPCVN